MSAYGLAPSVIEDDPRHGYRVVDVYSRLLEDRIIYIGGPITDDKADDVVAQLIVLANMDSARDATIYVNSPGGSMSALTAIVDAMDLVSCDVSTLCVGQATGAAAVIVAAGTKGKRALLPNSTLVLHQPEMGNSWGKATEIEIQANEMARKRGWLEELLAERTGQPRDRLHRDLENHVYLPADQALEYGLADSIVTAQNQTA